jgi:hypothetical protein
MRQKDCLRFGWAVFKPFACGPGKCVDKETTPFCLLPPLHQALRALCWLPSMIHSARAADLQVRAGMLACAHGPVQPRDGMCMQSALAVGSAALHMEPSADVAPMNVDGTLFGKAAVLMCFRQPRLRAKRHTPFLPCPSWQTTGRNLWRNDHALNITRKILLFTMTL